MTPRQITAYVIIVSRRLRLKKASQLSLMATASRDDLKNVKSAIKSLLDGP